MKMHCKPISTQAITVVLLLVVYNGVLNVSGDLQVFPLWDFDIASSCLLTMENETKLTGDLNATCTVEIETSRPDMGIGIQIAEEIPSNVVVYAEKQGDLLSCQNRYVDITADHSCSRVFSHTRLQLFLQGSTSVLISEIPMNQSPRCPEESNPAMPQTVLCPFYEYDRTVTCLSFVNHTCNITLLHHCIAIIGNRRVDYQCPDEDVDFDDFDPDAGDDFLVDTALIVYPDGITTLNISYQNVKQIGRDAFTYLKFLDWLDISHNILSGLHFKSFAGLQNLHKLSLQNNTLSTLNEQTFVGLFDLTHLYLHENILSLLPPVLFNDLGRLEVLDLSHNFIHVLHSNIFQPLHELTNLSMAFNILGFLPNGLFSENQKLLNLKLHANFLTSLSSDLFRGLTNLNELYLHGNALDGLDEELFLYNSQLATLALSYNHLKILPHNLFAGLVNLEELHLDQNQMTSMNAVLFSENSKLTKLFMDNNKIQDLPGQLFHSLRDLTHLTIQGNPLTTFHKLLFQSLPSLEVLMLSRNFLTGLSYDTFWGLGNLTTLTLHGNHLATLHPNIFRGLRNLEVLFLPHNQLRDLDVDLFKDLVSLRHLELSFNHLTNIPNLSGLKQLDFIGLISNSLTMVDGQSFKGISSVSDVEVVVDQTVICECYVPSNNNCNALDWRSPYLTCDRLLSDRALLVIMWIIGLNAISGNLYVLFRKTEAKNVQTTLLRNLAASDFLMGIYMLIIAYADIHFGKYFPMRAETWRSGITCKITGAIALTSSEASVFFVTLISIDRLINIRFSQSSHKLRKKSAVVILTLLWIFALALGIIPSALAGLNHKFYDKSHVCIGLPLALYGEYHKTVSFEVIHEETYLYTKYLVKTFHIGHVKGLYYSSTLFIGLNGLCILTVLLCYMEIVRYARKSMKSAGLDQDMKEQIGMTLEVTAVVLTDFFCWSPIILMGIFVQLGLLVLPPSVYAWSVSVILPLNSALNPYLYTVATSIRNRRQRVDVDKTEMKSISETEYKT